MLLPEPLLNLSAFFEANRQANADRIIKQLVQAGILTEVTGQARNRVFRADAVLQAIQEPLESD